MNSGNDGCFWKSKKGSMGQNHQRCLHREDEVGTESSWGLDLFWDGNWSNCMNNAFHRMFIEK